MRCMLLVLVGCAGRVDQVGAASWTGSNLAGNPTASGEPFDPDSMSASHRSLPFGTKVRVRSLQSGRKVKVWINDRGPYVKGRVIGLAERAAHRIRMIDDGVVDVELKVKSCGSRERANCDLSKPKSNRRRWRRSKRRR